MRVRRRLIVVSGVAVLAAATVWGLRAGMWGAKYHPWNAATASRVDEIMLRVAGGGEDEYMVAQLDLRALGPSATRPLIPYLVHENPRLRELGTSSLGNVGDWSIVELLCARLDDPAPRVRRLAVLSLHRLAAREVAHLLRGHAADPDDPTRAAIAMALGDLSAPENVGTLRTMVSDENGAVRLMAVVSLGRLGHADAVPALVMGLGDAQGRNRDAAAHSLSMLTGLPPHGDGALWMAWWAVRPAA